VASKWLGEDGAKLKSMHSGRVRVSLKKGKSGAAEKKGDGRLAKGGRDAFPNSPGKVLPHRERASYNMRAGEKPGTKSSDQEKSHLPAM